MRPPAIHQVYQICPDDVIVVVFGDGSIYEYSDFRTPVETVIAAFIHGRKFNAPGFRRPKYPRFTGPYERLESVPGGALLVYEEPPYRATEAPAECPLEPVFFAIEDFDPNAFDAGLFGCVTTAASGVPVWDGTFRAEHTSESFYVSATENIMSLQGFEILTGNGDTVNRTGIVGVLSNWTLMIALGNGNAIWVGARVGATTGLYSRFAGCSALPDELTII
jgi:hypothetical protein